MPTHKEHCEKCLLRFGKPFEEVHLWLDEFAHWRGFSGIRHRRERHHREGIAEVVRRFGNEAGKAAYLHIVDGLRQLGWEKGKDPFPKNKKEYEELELVLLFRTKEK